MFQLLKCEVVGLPNSVTPRDFGLEQREGRLAVSRCEGLLGAETSHRHSTVLGSHCFLEFFIIFIVFLTDKLAEEVRA